MERERSKGTKIEGHGGAVRRTDQLAGNQAQTQPEPVAGHGCNKVPPKNIPAEKTVLGACLINASACAVVLDTLKAEQFYATPHQTIFRTIKTIYDAGDPVDLVSAAEHLERHGLLDSVGGAEALASLEQHVLTTQNIDHYCRLVHDA